VITRNRLSVTAMAAIAVASLIYLDRLGMHVADLGHNRTATMSVPDTDGLVAGANVMLRGIAIGQVTLVTPAADHVEITWEYSDKYRIPIDTRYRLDDLSALGETFLSVLPATESGPYLADNAVIPDRDVTVPTTIKELSERLTRLLEQVDPKRVDEIFRTMDIALPDDAEVVGDLSHAGTLLADTVIHQSDGLTKLLNAMQPLLLHSQTLGPDMAGAAPEFGYLGTRLSRMIDGLYTSVNFATGNTPWWMPGLADGVTPVLKDLQTFLDKAAHDLNILGVDLLPSIQSGTAAMRTVNVDLLLDNALASTGHGDSITVHLRSPGGK
jgi:virulence factor Mce-like protein